MVTLYIMSGCPGSGKSTWAHRFHQKRTMTCYVSRDAIRAKLVGDEEAYFSHEDEVYDQFVRAIADNLSKNIDTIADATNLTANSRSKLVNALRVKCGLNTTQYEIVFVHMNTPVEECVKRDMQREGRQCVSAAVVRRMFYQGSQPSIDEFPNVREVWVINGRNMANQ